MTREAGIVRTTAGMEGALDELKVLSLTLGDATDTFVLSPSWYELRNILTCAILILSQSLQRKENKGGFFNKNLEVTEFV